MIVSHRVIEIRVVDHVDSLSFVEFAFYIEQRFVHCLTLAELVDQPAIFFVFAILEQSA